MIIEPELIIRDYNSSVLSATRKAFYYLQPVKLKVLKAYSELAICIFHACLLISFQVSGAGLGSPLVPCILLAPFNQRLRR